MLRTHRIHRIMPHADLQGVVWDWRSGSIAATHHGTIARVRWRIAHEEVRGGGGLVCAVAEGELALADRKDIAPEASVAEAPVRRQAQRGRCSTAGWEEAGEAGALSS